MAVDHWVSPILLNYFSEFVMTMIIILNLLGAATGPLLTGWVSDHYVCSLISVGPRKLFMIRMYTSLIDFRGGTMPSMY